MSIEDIFRMIASKKEEAPKPPTWILCGLGNPGDQYKETRHNVGFRVLDSLAEDKKAPIKRLAHKALTEKMIFAKKDDTPVSVLVMKPQTFMNASGEAVRAAADYYRIPADHILVVYDDVSMQEGQIRVRAKGSDGGHNGIKSIISHLQTDRFPRIKVGVGAKPRDEYDLADWVLGVPTGEKAIAQKEGEERCKKAIEILLSDGIERAMALFNAVPKPKKEEEA